MVNLIRSAIKYVTDYKKRRLVLKRKEEFLKYYGVDNKCPGCNKWASESSHVSPVEYLPEEFGYSMICGCGHKSYWNSFIAPVAILSDQHGLPIG